MSLLLLFTTSGAVTGITGSAAQLIGGENVVDDDGEAVLDANGVQITVPNTNITQDVTSFVNESTPFTGGAAQTIPDVTQEVEADITLFGQAAQTIDDVTQEAEGIGPRIGVSRATIPDVEQETHVIVRKGAGNSGGPRLWWHSPPKKKRKKTDKQPVRPAIVDLTPGMERNRQSMDRLMATASDRANAVSQQIRQAQIDADDMRAIERFLNQ